MTHVPIRILIVEDEPQVPKFLGASLESEGSRTPEAATGREGIELARTHNPDIILVDLGLPDIDGMVVTRSLRELSSKPSIIIRARGQEEKRFVRSTSHPCMRGDDSRRAHLAPVGDGDPR